MLAQMSKMDTSAEQIGLGKGDWFRQGSGGNLNLKRWRDTQLHLTFKSEENFKPLVEMPHTRACTSLGQRQYLSSPWKGALPVPKPGWLAPVSLPVPHHGTHVLRTREDCEGSSALPCVYTASPNCSLLGRGHRTC